MNTFSLCLSHRDAEILGCNTKFYRYGSDTVSFSPIANVKRHLLKCYLIQYPFHKQHACCRCSYLTLACATIDWHNGKTRTNFPLGLYVSGIGKIYTRTMYFHFVEKMKTSLFRKVFASEYFFVCLARGASLGKHHILFINSQNGPSSEDVLQKAWIRGLSIVLVLRS